MRLNPTNPADDPSPEDIDEDPLTYFLTPAPLPDDVDDDSNIMDFDAGIEDSSHPREIVRSVSPSTLDGLSRPKTRKASPEPELSDGPTPDEDDDEEYVRFRPNAFGLPFGLGDLTIDGIKLKPRAATAPATTGTDFTTDALLSPSSFHIPAARGRTPARGHGRGRTRSLSARKRPQHLWREPSPDVWSIEEETEEELNSEMSGSIAQSDAGDSGADKKAEELKNKETNIEIPAAKPRKKVRFVLPVKE